MGSSYTLSVSAKGGLSQSPLMPAANSRVIQLVQSPPDPELLSPNLSAPQPATAATISRVTPVLHLDRVNTNWTEKLPGVDYAILSGGNWFFRGLNLYGGGEIVGCVNCRGQNLTDFGVAAAIRSVLRTALQFVTTCKECEGLVTFLRTFTPSHFENGSWFSGGHCNRTQPLDESQISLSDITWEIRKVQLEEIERARRQDGEVNIKFEVLDVTKAMMLRADAHPGNHWTTKGSVNDCLPGPVDLWSDLLLATLEKSSLSHQLHTYLYVSSSHEHFIICLVCTLHSVSAVSKAWKSHRP
ncbi:hypothetical protein BHE74_00004810 [Ensete ventricosum]|nr:hypothetical protein BHE74_00004810 [Ensete ventricosum]